MTGAANDTLLFPRHSEMAGRIREFDWSATPLGAPANWPPGLRSAVGLCLNSRLPMLVWWGPELLNLYNDAYAPLFGQRHPAALGRPAREIWAELWPAIGEDVDAAFLRGEAVLRERVRLIDGRAEEAYQTFAFSPIPDDLGGIGGVLQICTDETARYKTEQNRSDQTARLQLALDAANMGWWRYDPRTQVSTWDERFKQIFGVTKNERHNSELLAKLHPEDLPGVEAAIAAALDPANPKPFAIEYRVIHDDQSERWIEAHGLATFEGAGAARRAANFVGTVADITARKCTEELQRRNQETFEKLIEQAPFGVYVIDAQFRIRQVNSGAQPAFANVRPLLGRDFGEAMRILWPEPFASNVIRFFRRTLETGETYTAPSLTEQRNDMGVVESYEWQLNRVMLPDGQFAVVCYFFDATRLRRTEGQLRESRERLQAAIDGSGAGTFRWNLQTQELEWDENLNRLFGLLRGQTIRQLKNFVSTIHPDERAAVLEHCEKCARDGANFDQEFRVIWPDGRVRWLDGKGRTFFDPDQRPLYMTGMYLDITERKQATEELRHAGVRKDEFIATLAHELRNPLAPLKTGLHLLKVTQDKAAAFEKTRAIMERQMNQLVRLIDDLMDISRLTSGKLQMRPEHVPLSTVMELALETARPHLDAAELQLRVTLPPQPVFIHADSGRLAQAFSNLIHNACKFSEPGGLICLTAETGNSELKVIVSDTGVGIQPEHMAVLFDMFTQVDSTLNRAQGGLGIGLALVKAIVEMHRGSVTAQSGGPGKGSVFSVRLPVLVQAPDATSSSAEIPSTQEHPPRRRILIADDNCDITDCLGMLLELQGNEVEIAHDGLEAVKAAERFRPEAVLLDIGMPGMNGYDACGEIRRQPWGKDMILIALTGWGAERDRKRTAEIGFDAHLIKPVEPEVLIQLLTELKK